MSMPLDPPPPPRYRDDFDLNRGSFRLDLKTLVMLGALAFGWWDNNAETRKQAEESRKEVAALRAELLTTEKARAEVEAANARVAEVQRQALEASLTEFRKKVEVATIAIDELKLAAASRRSTNGG